MYFCNLLLISPFIPQELAEVSKFGAFSMSGSLCWLSFNSYYFSAWPIHHLECFLIYCGIMLTAVPWTMWAWNGDTRMCSHWQKHNLFIFWSQQSGTAGIYGRDGCRMLHGAGCRLDFSTSSWNPAGASCVSQQLLFPLFKIILLMLMTSASSDVGPAKGGNVWTSVCLHSPFGSIPVFGSASPLESLWALNCWGVSYGWWEGIQMELLGLWQLWEVCQHFWAGKTVKVKLCLFHTPWRGGAAAGGAAGLGVAPMVQAILLTIKFFFFPNGFSA